VNCAVGFYNTNSGSCEPCTNKPQSNAQYTSNSDAINPNACAWTCLIGFYKTKDACMPCSTSDCPAGQYRTQCTVTADSKCIPCTNSKPANAVYSSSGSPLNSNNCQWACATGFFLKGDACAACNTASCPVGQYRSACTANADGVCQPCTKADKSNAAYSTAGVPYNTDTCAWACNTGYYKTGGLCRACTATSCAIGQYRSPCLSESDGACLACTIKPASSDFVAPGSPYNANNCAWACVGGYYQSGGACYQCTSTACATGQYRSKCTATSDGRCVPCTNPIPQNAVYSSAGSPYDSNSCAWVCNPGYYKSGGLCQPCSTTRCEAGLYRGPCTATGDGPCVACTSKPTSSNFVGGGNPYNTNSCPWGCVPGYYTTGATCEICATSACGVGFYRTACRVATNSQCTPCTNTLPANAAYTAAGSPFDSNNCAWGCNVGYFKSGASCVPCTRTQCAVGQYRETCTPLQDGACKPCTSWQPDHAAFVTAGPYGLNQCDWGCIDGYYRSGSTCQPCSVGTCPVGQYRTACTSAANSVCTSCTNRPPNGVYTSAGTQGAPASCQTSCATGYVRQADRSCKLCDTSTCPVGQYRGECKVDADGACGPCTNKPANSAYTGAGQPYGSNNCAWACNAGYYRSNGECKPCSTAACPVGQYRGECAATTDAPCVVCTGRPSNSQYTSAGVPYNANACTWACISGYFRASGACVACSTSSCAAGQYRGACTATADAPCVACTKGPAHSTYTSAGSPTNTDTCSWACNANWYRSNGECKACTTDACPVGQYRGVCTSTSDGLCTACTRTANSVFTSAGVPYNADACAFSCQAGYYQSGSRCVACSNPSCPTGQYPTGCPAGSKTDSVCAACTSLPNGATYLSAGTVRARCGVSDCAGDWVGGYTLAFDECRVIIRSAHDYLDQCRLTTRVL
jgi:hypothetical protein